MTTTSCVFIGDGSLLIQCAERMLELGHAVEGVVTADDGIRQWADGRGLATAHPDDDLDAFLARAPFDWLFSVVNLRILPASVIEAPRTMAVNFHDGPLPRYAGIHATTWALMGGETTHGVTWHEMTAQADRGRILQQQMFDLAPDETAFSLNARCFDAGMASFSELAQAITDDRVAPVEQDFSQRSWFGMYKRPDALSTLRFDTDAASLRAFVAALDFGAYANPVARAKVLLPDGSLACVAQATDTGTASTKPPGTVVSSGSDGLVVATTTNDVRFGRVIAPHGPALAPSALPPAGAVLGTLDDATAARLTEMTPALARAEAGHRKTLSTLSPWPSPFSRPDVSAKGRRPIDVALPPAFRSWAHEGERPADRVLAGVCALLARVAGEATFDVGFDDTELRAKAEGLERWLAPTAAFRVSADLRAPTAQALDAIADALAAQRAAGPWQRDLLSREPALSSVPVIDGSVAFPVVLRTGAVLHQGLPQGVALRLSVADDARGVHVDACPHTISNDALSSIVRQLGALLTAMGHDLQRPLGRQPVITAEEQKLLETWNATAVEWPEQACLHELFEAQVKARPDATAVRCDGTALTYRELDEQANRLAHRLRDIGVGPDGLVGVFMDRSTHMVVAMLGVLKAGGAYVPLDPSYPRDRIRFMIEDADIEVVCTTTTRAAELGYDAVEEVIVDEVAHDARWSDESPVRAGNSANLAYVIYTSGSTGRPKGVMVEHRNAVNFFVGMDERLGYDPDNPGVWLAVTSINFDISVLELLWTLTRGFEVVLYVERDRPGLSRLRHASKSIDMSLFFFASDEGEHAAEKYNLLIEAAKFADTNGFSAVWTPERHFHAFGGLYPNPSVAAAALSTITSNVQLRAGSCVSPLHHPVRIAEEWSVVDNLSHGRVGISFAAGWQPDDFVLMPQNYADRREKMFQDIEDVRALWRGDEVEYPNGVGRMVKLRTLPRPIQSHLPIWVTAAGNPDTFRQAGEVGCHLLTHLLGQTVDELADKIAIYREAWQKAGHEGRGIVSLMLHTLVGLDADRVKEQAREPMKGYLQSAMDLVRRAAWEFPTFKKTTQMEDGSFSVDHLSAEEQDAVLDYAFERYYETAGLFGTIDDAVALVDRMKGIDVDDVACLIDYGVPSDVVFEHLPPLAQVLRRSNAAATRNVDADAFTIPALIERHGVTHMQCTPSMAQMLLVDEPVRAALGGLQRFLVGGEALPAPLARDLEAAVGGDVINMYGPTETTVWSSTWPVRDVADDVLIGTPIANTDILIVDRNLQLCPPGVAGELLIGGAGVVRGYLHRPELTGERFVPHPSREGERIYRTGDLARWRSDGVLEFIGRLDHQVKVNGYRIELGEIEAVLGQHDDVAEAAVIVREDQPGARRIVGYIVPRGDASPSSDDLRDFLSERLPEYMIPAIVATLPAFPQTPNRKIDRKAFPVPEQAKEAVAAEFEAPESDLEASIATIWRDVLGVPRVGTADNFFDLGGHSLLMIQVHSKIKAAVERPVTLVDLFRFPTVRSLADFLAQADDGGKALEESAARADARKAALDRRSAMRDRRRR